MDCFLCIDTTDYDKIPTNNPSPAINIHNTPNARTGFCVPKDKFIFYNAANCLYYSTTYANIATINSLTCASVTNTGTDGTYNPFVLADASYSGGVCTDGSLKVTDGTNTACVRSGIIDYCKTYISAGFSSTATALTVGCK